MTGYERFCDYFHDFKSAITIIGGTALSEIYHSINQESRATKDIDCVLLLEGDAPRFIAKLSAFVKEGGYEGARGKNYCSFRFVRPTNNSFPSQIELFSADEKHGKDIAKHIKHLSVSEGAASFSAIMLDPVYYQFVKERKRLHSDVFYIDPYGILALK